MNIFQFRRLYFANNYHLADDISIIINNLDKELFLALWLVCYIKQNKCLCKQMIIH